MKDMIKVNKLDHPKNFFMKVPCRESTENTKKSAFLSIGAQEGVKKSMLGLSHEFFFCMDLGDIHRYLHTKFHPNLSKYMVADQI